jgi:Spy/CpxP family protein refolding chaperone
MNRIKILSCAGAVALTGFVGMAWAAGVNDHAPPYAFRHALLGKLTELGVSQAQKEQIHTVLRESRGTIKPLVTQYVQERRALRKTIQTAPVNEAAILAQAARVAQIEADLDVRRAHISERIRGVLTPEQVEKLKLIAGIVDAHVDAMLERINDRIAGP